MSKYKLLLDESGSFDNKDEKYVIIGGVLFKEEYQPELEKIFVPLHTHLRNVLKCTELHATRNKELFDYLAPILGACEYITPIVFVIDKKSSFIFDNYDHKSFKYNKAIQHLIKKMIKNGLVNNDDELYIKIDNINLNRDETDNLTNWLPKNMSIVKEVKQGDSRDYIALQLADIIVNNFSKKTTCKLNSVRVKMLSPKIYCFLNKTVKEYFI